MLVAQNVLFCIYGLESRLAFFWRYKEKSNRLLLFREQQFPFDFFQTHNYIIVAVLINRKYTYHFKICFLYSVVTVVR